MAPGQATGAGGANSDRGAEMSRALATSRNNSRCGGMQSKSRRAITEGSPRRVAHESGTRRQGGPACRVVWDEV